LAEEIPHMPEIPTELSKINLTGVHVFVVEDDADSRDLLSEVLGYCGALVHTCTSTEEALTDLKQFLPAVILCDLSLPGADGFAFIRALRKLPAKRGGLLPAIAISAYYEDFARPEALRLGFNEYLEKPLELNRLATTLARLIWVTQRTASEKV
jgi:CheY-like chemotaxis protein